MQYLIKKVYLARRDGEDKSKAPMFRTLGCFVSETDNERTVLLPEVCRQQEALLGQFSIEQVMQPSVQENIRLDGRHERTVVYSDATMNELVHHLTLFKSSGLFPDITLVVDDKTVYSNPDQKNLFKFKLDCIKQQHGL